MIELVSHVCIFYDGKNKKLTIYAVKMCDSLLFLWTTFCVKNFAS